MVLNANNARSIEEPCDPYAANATFSRPVTLEHSELERCGSAPSHQSSTDGLARHGDNK